MSSQLPFLEFWREATVLQLVLGSFAVAYGTYYLLFVVRKPRLLFKTDSTLGNFLLNRCPILSESYWPTFWCFEGRFQTVVASVIKSHPMIKYRRELVQIPDGGELYLHWVDSDIDSKLSDENTHPTVLILPGLTGTYNNNYILQLVMTMKNLGFRVVVFNNRGLAGCKLKTPKAFCAAYTDDLEFVLSHIHGIYPTIPLIAIGYSLGGIILTNYLSKLGPHNRDVGLIGAMTVSVPWDIFKSTESLEEPLNYLLFNRHLTNLLHGIFKENIAMAELHKNELPFDIDHILKARTVQDFDNRVIAPMFGFKNSSEYYSAATLHTKPLHTINVPLLCLSSADDPFAPLHSIPIDLIKKCPNVVLVLTDYGGHTSFVEGVFPFGQSYMDRLAGQFAKAIFEQGLKS